MEKRVQYESVFKHFDNNKDGKLSPFELQRCVSSMGGELTLSEAESVVTMLDSDGDGMLGFSDFLKFVKMEEDEEEDEKVKVLLEAFNMYKMDGGELITDVSLKRMLEKLGQKMSVEDCKKVIRVFDLNGDGVLNFDEFRVMMS